MLAMVSTGVGEREAMQRRQVLVPPFGHAMNAASPLRRPYTLIAVGWVSGVEQVAVRGR
jgi:hypothetical protein